MQIIAIPCLKDNYAYLVICKQSNEAVVIDPGESAPILSVLDETKATLKAIWNTHHHFDHVGGNKDLVTHFQGLEVVAHLSDKGRVPKQNVFVDDGDEVTVGRFKARILTNPGHTRGAISYYLNQTSLFTGDTLFGGGCGRLFEGNGSQMQASFDKIMGLPGDTRVYFGHEYTVANLNFAHTLEPNNKAIAERLLQAKLLRQKNEPTLPSTLSLESQTNPFARTRCPAIKSFVQTNHPDLFVSTPAEVFASIRQMKDNF